MGYTDTLGEKTTKCICTACVIGPLVKAETLFFGYSSAVICFRLSFTLAQIIFISLLGAYVFLVFYKVSSSALVR